MECGVSGLTLAAVLQVAARAWNRGLEVVLDRFTRVETALEKHLKNSNVKMDYAQVFLISFFLSSLFMSFSMLSINQTFLSFFLPSFFLHFPLLLNCYLFIDRGQTSLNFFQFRSNCKCHKELTITHIFPFNKMVEKS